MSVPPDVLDSALAMLYARTAEIVLGGVGSRYAVKAFRDIRKERQRTKDTTSMSPDEYSAHLTTLLDGYETSVASRMQKPFF